MHEGDERKRHGMRPSPGYPGQVDRQPSRTATRGRGRPNRPAAVSSTDRRTSMSRFAEMGALAPGPGVRRREIRANRPHDRHRCHFATRPPNRRSIHPWRSRRPRSQPRRPQGVIRAGGGVPRQGVGGRAPCHARLDFEPRRIDPLQRPGDRRGAESQAAGSDQPEPPCLAGRQRGEFAPRCVRLSLSR